MLLGKSSDEPIDMGMVEQRSTNLIPYSETNSIVST